MDAKKKPKEPGGERLKLNVSWEDAADRLLKTPAGSVPPRKVKKRKKKRAGQ